VGIFLTSWKTGSFSRRTLLYRVGKYVENLDLLFRNEREINYLKHNDLMSVMPFTTAIYHEHCKTVKPAKPCRKLHHLYWQKTSLQLKKIIQTDKLSDYLMIFVHYLICVCASLCFGMKFIVLAKQWHVRVEMTVLWHVIVEMTVQWHVTVEVTVEWHVTVEMTVQWPVTVEMSVLWHVIVEMTVQWHVTVEMTVEWQVTVDIIL
jgi:hypothetical protein